MTTRTVFGQLLALLLAFSLVFPATVWAQEDGAAKAAALYDEATVAYQQGDYKKAADLLDLAFGANPDLVYKYNRILALQALGDFELALTELNAMYTPMKADNQNRFDDIDEIKAQLETAIARNQPPVEDPPTDEPPADDPPAVEKKPNYLAWGLIGGGALMLGAGGLIATEIFLPNEDARQNQQIAALALMGGGLVVAGVGVVLLLLPDKEDGSATTGLDSLRFAPYVTHKGAGAAFSLRF